MNSLFVNPRAVLFHDYLDKMNSYSTIVYNSKTETFLKVNSSGYKILRTIDENPGIAFDDISNMVRVKKEATEKFIRTMLEENVVFVK